MLTSFFPHITSTHSQNIKISASEKFFLTYNTYIQLMIASTLAIELSKKLAISFAGELIKNSGKFVFRKMFGVERTDYEKELNGVIHSTINEFDQKHHIFDDGHKFPFYHSEILIQNFLSIKLLGKNIDGISLKKGLLENENIIPPTEAQITKFLEIFQSKCEQNALLKKHQYSENYKEAIFEVLDIVSSIDTKINRTFSEISTTLKGEYIAQISEIQENINSFKPATALSRIETLKARIATNNLLTSDVEAKLLFLQGTCMIDYNQDMHGFENIVKAYLKLPDSFKADASVAYYNLKEVDKAKKLAEEVCLTNPYDGKGWLVLLFLQQDVTKSFLKTIPPSVIEKRGFQATAFKFLRIEKQLSRKAIEELGLTVPSKFEEAVTYNNFHFWEICAEVWLVDYFETTDMFNFNRKGQVSYPNLENIPALVALLTKLVETLRGTEVENNIHYLHFKFYRYFLKHLLGEQNFDKEEFKTIFDNVKISRDYYVLHYAQYSANCGDLKGAIEIIEQSAFSSQKFLSFHKICYLLASDKKVDAHTELQNYIERLGIISFEDIFNISDFFRAFLPEIEVLKKEFDEIILKKQFSSPSIKTLFEIVFKIKYFSDGIDEQITTTLYDIAKEFKSEKHVIVYICGLLLTVKQYLKCAELIEPFIISGVQSQENFLFAMSCTYIPSRRKDALLLLENIRKENEVNHYEFLELEFNLRVELRDVENIVEISWKGIRQFPSIELWHQYLLSALEQKSSTAEIQEYVDKHFKNDFENETIGIWVSTVLSRTGFIKEAANLHFNLANKSSNLQARINYLLFPFPKDFFVQYNTIELGSFVKLITEEGRIKLLKVDEKNKSSLVGKQVNESVLISDKLGLTYTKYNVVAIMNDKAFLYEQIIVEANNPDSDLMVKSGNFTKEDGTFDFEQFNTFLISNFGVESSQRQNQIKKLVDGYNDGIESFGDLCRNLFHSDLVECYQFLTSSKFLTLQSPINISVEIVSEHKFAIDFTTLFLFSDLEQNGVKIEKRYTVSKSLVQLLKNNLIELKSHPAPKMKLVVTDNEVQKILYPENYNDDQIAIYERLLKFVGDHCEEKRIDERVEFTFGMNETMDLFMQYQLDNALLASNLNYVLISNDKFLNKYLPYVQLQIISPENHFYQLYSKNYPHQISSYYVTKNYVGVQITAEILLEEYQKKLSGQNNNFNSCLMNLRPRVNPYSFIISVAINFLKEIFINTITQSLEKEMVTQLVFANLLDGAVANDQFLRDVRKHISASFKLLGNKIDVVNRIFNDTVFLLRKDN
jgi:hypothetical protein